MADLFESLGYTPEQAQQARAEYAATPRSCCGRRNDAPLETRVCSQGNCTEWWCPCGAFTETNAGPVGCTCEDGPPWIT